MRWGRAACARDMVDLAAGDSELDQRPSSGSAEPPAPELRGDFVADLDSAVDRRGGEATRAKEAPGRVIDEEHRPRAVGLRRGLEMLQGKRDGLGELGPAVRTGEPINSPNRARSSFSARNNGTVAARRRTCG